jgi:3-oxoacyl-[acyl-carrier protein] reductase
MTSKKVAVVTGGSRGIGRACVARLAADGFDVAVGYASRGDEAEQACAEAERHGVRARAIQVDVGDEASVAGLFDATEATFGGVDAVVNAAGRMDLQPLKDFDLGVLDEMFRVNLRGAFLVAQQAVRRVRAGGAIVSFSSCVIGRALPSYTGYAATKAGIEAMTFILAHELRGRDVTVNAVAPGPTATEMFLADKTEEQVAFFANAVPLERLGVPADIAAAVSFLCGADGRWTNGQTLRVNGGLI